MLAPQQSQLLGLVSVLAPSVADCNTAVVVTSKVRVTAKHADGDGIIDSRLKSRLAVTALTNAVTRRAAEGTTVTGCICHSDRGSQFRSRKFVHALHRHGLVGSMGRVGAAGDNAAMESFFALLQKNVLNRRAWATR